jgi:2-oxoglutarate dehydrogenase E1 component
VVNIVSDGGSLLQQLAETSQFGGGNAAYLDQLYEDWLRDPQSVAPQWRTWFQSLRGTGDVAHADAIARIVAAQNAREAAPGRSAAGPGD